MEKLHSLDYNTLRTPLTKLTKEELDYCEMDCKIVYEGIKKYREQYKHIKDIPLTQTGCPRREVKKIITKDRGLQRQLVKLIPHDSEEYKNIKAAFAGGYTHANYALSGRVFTEEKMGHPGYAFDFASSYPTIVCSEKFPMTPWEPCLYNKNELDKYSYLMKVKFTNLEGKTLNHYLSYSKSIADEEELEFRENSKKPALWLDNGRVIRFKGSLTYWLTEQDYEIIKKTYKGKAEVLECYRSRKAYLPKCFITYILDLYNNKTKLKGAKTQGEKDLYNQSKQYINAAGFGMMVTDLCQDEVLFDNGDWNWVFNTLNDVESFLIDLKENNKNRTFLSYSWGVWVAAYGRANLWDCILHVNEDGTCNEEDVIYCDTDSLKLREYHDFTWYNEKVSKKLKDMCDTLEIDFELTRPKDRKGKEHPLGIFDREDDWSEFVTLGAKRYCYRSKKDGLLHLTVSGINKDAVLILNDDINNFTEETIFDKDFKLYNGDLKDENHPLHKYYDETMDDDELRGVKKNLPSYNCNKQTIVWNKGKYDEYKSSYKHGIVIRPTSYSMGVDEDYMQLIKNMIDRNHLLCI